MSESANSLKSIEFTWKISNYSQQKLKNGPGKRISSQTFSVSYEGDLEFTLKFYPQGYVQSDDDEVTNGEKWASVFLDAEGRKKYDTSNHFELSFLDADGEKLCKHRFHDKIPFKGWGYPKFIRHADLENPVNNLMQNDTLTICCRVEETNSETKSESTECDCLTEKTATTRARRKLGEDLACVLDDKYADFVFKVENEKIAAHKNILAARSPVFDAMFQHNMLENRTNEAEIKDVTPAAFKALLQFIYTGHCKVGNLAEELLIAANKYDIQELKQICAKKSGKKLTVDNAVRLLVLSDLHRARDLKGGVIRFINENAAAVMKTPSWSNFPKSHPNLLFELYRKIVESK
jgi:speckle-type POZ protein